jgi:hypothetical protein
MFLIVDGSRSSHVKFRAETSSSFRTSERSRIEKSTFETALRQKLGALSEINLVSILFIAFGFPAKDPRTFAARYSRDSFESSRKGFSPPTHPASFQVAKEWLKGTVGKQVGKYNATMVGSVILLVNAHRCCAMVAWWWWWWLP